MRLWVTGRNGKERRATEREAREEKLRWEFPEKEKQSRRKPQAD